MTSNQIARSTKHYNFVCKRGQHKRVAKVLSLLGMAPRQVAGRYLRGVWNSDGTMVYAELTGLSKRYIDKVMFHVGIPGSRNG